MSKVQKQGGVGLGIYLPHVGAQSTPAAIRDVVAAAKENRFSALWVGDHIVFPRFDYEGYPYSKSGRLKMDPESDFLEAFTTLGFASAISDGLTIGISVCVAGYRNPLLVAKMVGTLSRLNEGPVILGVGAGWMREEFEMLGVPYAERQNRADQLAGLMRKIFEDGGETGFEAGELTVRPFHVEPRPQAGKVQIWVGGNEPKARSRTAIYGDRWFPALFGMDPDKLKSSYQELLDRVDAEKIVAPGRIGAPGVALWTTVVLSDNQNEPGNMPWESGAIQGSVDYIADMLRKYQEAGVTEFVITPSGSVATRIKIMEGLSALA